MDSGFGGTINSEWNFDSVRSNASLRAFSRDVRNVLDQPVEEEDGEYDGGHVRYQPSQGRDGFEYDDEEYYDDEDGYDTTEAVSGSTLPPPRTTTHHPLGNFDAAHSTARLQVCLFFFPLLYF